GIINWQPNVAAATVSGVGKVISYSQDLPRSDGKTWSEHTCCVFGANEDGLKNKELATVLTGLMLLGNQYIIDYPDEAATAVANWMYGNTDPTFGSSTVKAIDIIKTSLPTIKFSTELTDTWKDSTYEFVETQRALGTVVNNLKSTSREETEALLYDFDPYYAAKKVIDEKGTFTEPVSGKITIGSLRSDHDSPLYVLLKNWEYFKDTYNTYLKPSSSSSTVGPVSDAELYVNGKKICDVEVVEGSGGPNIMTLLQTGQAQYAIAGAPPFISSIDTRTGIKILSPIMTEGSGFLVSSKASVNTWDEFAAWAKQSSAEGKNLVVAVPQYNSIQDVMLRYALESSGLTYVKKTV
ncbi:MAG TPA: ABC transporter substrate-binding protein, partial [Methanocorpusculum sp.]|nr:ABC transporter substrate-binding protein [Methanocorpusculum sp.]